MVYSTEQLDRISELAALLTPISDMAVLLDVDADTLRLDILDRNSPVSRAYYYAKASTALKLRRRTGECGQSVGGVVDKRLSVEYGR